MRRALSLGGILLLLAIAIGMFTWRSPSAPRGTFTPPDGANVTYFPALRNEAGLPLVISASMDAGFMRPFLLAFQRHNPALSIAYCPSSEHSAQLAA